jgi:hypothetical protein
MNPDLAELHVCQQRGSRPADSTIRYKQRRQVMNRVLRIATVLAGLVASIIGVIAAAPAAFAMLEPGPGGSGQYVPPVTITHSGLTAWQVTLIAVAAAVAATLVTAVVLKIRTRTAGVRPAAS